MRWKITWFCDVTCDIRLHPVSDFYALLQYSFTCITMVNGDDGNFLEYKVKCNDFEPLVVSDTAESSSYSTLSEQFSKATSQSIFIF